MHGTSSVCWRSVSPTALPVSSRRASIALSSTLTVRGTSTLHDWYLTARRMTGHATLSNPSTPDAVLTEVELHIAVDDLEASGGLPMRSKLRDVLKSKHFPTVAVIMEATTPLVAADGGLQASGEAILHIAGRTAPAVLMARLVPGSDGTVRLTGEQTLSLRALGLKAPTAFFGQLKTGDAITVVFSIDLAPT
ncbi:MAG: hypothetical protein RhofKO_24270 [Rhodothermales bacterium]